MSGQADTIRGRAENARLKMWLLTRVTRPGLAAGLAVGFFLLMVGASAVAPTPMREVIDATDSMWETFAALVTAIITAVTVVIMFNQLVISQELGALGDQRGRMQESSAFRSDVEPWLEEAVGPPDPASFLAALLRGIEAAAADLEATGAGAGGDEHADVRSFVESVTANAQSVRARLDGAQFGTFDVIYAALRFNYSWKIYEARRLLAEHETELTEDSAQALEEMVTVLQFFGPAREHFKTLYFQWELVNLSRGILYSALPALFVSLWMLFYVDTADVTGTILGVDAVVWLVSAALVVALSPLFLVISYVLRVATVTKRTLAMGPFVLRDIEDEVSD